MERAVHPVLAPAYIVVDDDLVYEIAPNSVINIGRLDTNDIVLDDYKVSREHAVLKFSKKDFTLVDLASTHGCYINDVRIDRSTVDFGDTIRIAGHELTLCREVPEEPLNKNGSRMAPRMARSLDRRLKFFGGLNEFSLLTLVQFLHQERQSGLLLLEVGQHPGPRIYIQDGEITHVSQGEGLAELLIRKNHEESLFFYFHHETNFPKRTVMQPTPNFLMSLCHCHDENKLQEPDVAVAFMSSKPQTETARVLVAQDGW